MKEPREVVGTRVDKALKEKIERAAKLEDRRPAEIARKVLEMGWPVFLASLPPDKRKKVAA
jgi:hypothetical protein